MADKTINLIYKILGLDKATQKTRKLDSSLVNLAKTAKRVATGFVALQVAQSAVKFAVASQRVQDLEGAMLNLGKNAGFGADSLEKFRDATNGTVTDTELLTNANNALLLGIADSDDQMAQLFDTAQRLGKAMGVDTQFAVQSLTVGLGRQSKMILDNLGIMVDATSAQEKLAKEIGKTVGQLTEEERKRAFINEAMRQAKTAVQQLGAEELGLIERQQQLSVAVENLGLAFGEASTPAVLKATTAMTGFLNVVTETLFATSNQNDEIIKNQMSYMTLTPEIQSAFLLLKTLSHEYEVNSDVMEGQRQKIIDLVQAHKDEKNAIRDKNIERENARLASIEQNKILDKEERESRKAILDAFLKVELEHFKKRNEQRMEMNQTYEDSLIGLDQRQKERADRIAELEQKMQEPFLGLIGMTETFTQRLVQASIEGQNMEKILSSAVTSLAVEIASKTAIFGMLRLAGAILNPASGAGMAIETATGGGFGAFLLKGFTGQTSKVNQTININGGLVSQSYVKNTLLPAINNARAIG